MKLHFSNMAWEETLRNQSRQDLNSMIALISRVLQHKDETLPWLLESEFKLAKESSIAAIKQLRDRTGG